MATISIAVNEIGRRIGSSHHNAVLSERDVALIHQFHEEGWGYRRLAAKFEVSKSLVRNIVKYRTRCQTPAGWRKLQIKD